MCTKCASQLHINVSYNSILECGMTQTLFVILVCPTIVFRVWYKYIIVSTMTYTLPYYSTESAISPCPKIMFRVTITLCVKNSV